MSMQAAIRDPSQLEEVHRFLADNDPDSRLVPLEIHRLSIEFDAVGEVTDAVNAAMARASVQSDPRQVVMLVDTTLITRSGEDLKRMVEQELARGFEIARVVLDDGSETLHVDEAILDQATAASEQADCIVTVGSGTITDIGKVAADRVGGTPLVVVQTAASVDGFTDNVSVVLRSGVKRTIPSAWPDAVLADIETISQAPPSMNTSGFGEALSMFLAPGDWYLASLVGLDSSFHEAPRSLLSFSADELAGWSRGVSRGDPDSMQQLVRMLAIRGIATGVAGTTACLSGVEHLISHMFDLHHAQHGLPTGLHGAQVGVGSIVAAAAWELLFEAGPRSFGQLRFPSDAEMEARVREAFDGLDPSGGVGDECWSDYREKLQRARTNRDRFESLFEHWEHHRSDLGALVSACAPLREALNRSGAPAHVDELEPAVSPALARWAIANCHLMRSRLTVVDLLEFLGLWTKEAVDRVLEPVLPRTARDEDGA
jgi:glycerol-1-phosphate dehydrogenase [NAD(P)+]